MTRFLIFVGFILVSGISVWALIALAKEVASEKTKRIDLQDRLRRAGTLSRYLAKRLPNHDELDDWLRESSKPLPEDSRPGVSDD